MQHFIPQPLRSRGERWSTLYRELKSIRKRLAGAKTILSSCLLLFAHPLNGLAPGPAYAESSYPWKRVAKDLVKTPSKPDAWRSLAIYAYEREVYLDAFEALLTEKSLLGEGCDGDDELLKSIAEKEASTLSRGRVARFGYAGSSSVEILSLRAGLGVEARQPTWLFSYTWGPKRLSGPEFFAFSKKTKKEFVKLEPKVKWQKEGEKARIRERLRRGKRVAYGLYYDLYPLFYLEREDLYRTCGLSVAASAARQAIDAKAKQIEEYDEVLIRARSQELPVLRSYIERGVFKERACADYSRLFIDSLIDETLRTGSARRSLYSLFREMESAPAYSCLKDALKEEAQRRGISYLDSIRFTTRDIALTDESLISSSSSFLGTVSERGAFVSAAKTGEILMVYWDNDCCSRRRYVRGLASHADLRIVPAIPVGYDVDFFALKTFRDREIYGSFSEFVEETNPRSGFYSLFTKKPPDRLPREFTPYTLIRRSSKVSGGVLGFIERNPLTSALIIGGVSYLLSPDSVESSQSQPRRASPSVSRGSLRITFTNGEILRNTVDDFIVEIVEDNSVGYSSRTSGSGSSFWESRYASFPNLPKGKYKVKITGNSHDGRVHFSMSGVYSYGGGSVVCNANLGDKSMSCSSH